MEASGVVGAAAAIAAFAGGELCAQAVGCSVLFRRRRGRRRRNRAASCAQRGVRCADGACVACFSVPQVAALAGDAQAALQGRGVVLHAAGACARLPLRRQRRCAVCVGLYPPLRSPALPLRFWPAPWRGGAHLRWRDRQEGGIARGGA